MLLHRDLRVHGPLSSLQNTSAEARMAFLNPWVHAALVSWWLLIADSARDHQDALH